MREATIAVMEINMHIMSFQNVSGCGKLLFQKLKNSKAFDCREVPLILGFSTENDTDQGVL